MEDKKSLIKLKTFTTRLEAEFARGYLEVNGIIAFVAADDEGGMYPYPMSPTVNAVRLIVAKKDFEKAVKLLEMVK
jgi:hypothetical protein